MPANKNIVFDVVGTLVSPTTVEVAEREYTYLSISGADTPYATIFEKLFPRMLLMTGISNPASVSTPDDLAYIKGEYANLQLRPSALECVQKLRDTGFTVWALTAGDLNRVGIGKPDLRAYRPLLEKLKTEDGARPWFAAAHMWDASAARRTGFKGAYCTVYEKQAIPELFGEMEVTADSLPEMAARVIASEG